MQLLPVGHFFLPQTAEVGGNREAGDGSFNGMLNKAIKELNDVQVKADDLACKFLAGEIQDLHLVTAAMQEARLTMQLAVEVRNKVIEAYQEISRMQV